MDKKPYRFQLLFFILISVFFFNRNLDGLKDLLKKSESYQDSAAIRQMVEISKEHPLESFNLSPRIKADAWLNQQTLFRFWPVKLDEKSPWMIFSSQEDLGGCESIDRKSEVTLAKCE